MERRLGIMQSVEPVLENAIKTLQKVVDVRGMGKKWAILGNLIPWGMKIFMFCSFDWQTNESRLPRYSVMSIASACAGSMFIARNSWLVTWFVFKLIWVKLLAENEFFLHSFHSQLNKYITQTLKQARQPQRYRAAPGGGPVQSCGVRRARRKPKPDL